MPYPSSEISNQSQKDSAEEPSVPTATNWDIGKRTAATTNAHTVISINPTTKNIYVSFDPLDLTVDPKPLSNKNHPHHHLSLFTSCIKEGSKPGNPLPLSPPLSPHHHLTEGSRRIKEKGRKRIIIPANKERSKETSIGPSTR